MATQTDTDGTTIAYVRAATASRSVADQRERLLGYLETDLGLDREAISVLVDEGIKARADQSSSYRTMLDRVESGTVERVVITDASRVAKTMADFYEFVGTFLEAGVSLHVLDAGLRLGERSDLRTAETAPDDEVLHGLEIAASMESSVGAERTREGINAAKENGKHVGRPPFGFDSQNGRLVPNDEFDTALLVIERIENGKSKRSTAQVANITRTTVQNVVDRSDLYRNHAESSSGAG